MRNTPLPRMSRRGRVTVGVLVGVFLLFTLLGWGFGRATLRVLGHVRRYEKFLVAAILLALLVVFWVMRNRHVEDEVVEVLATGDTGPIPKLSDDEQSETRKGL